MTELLRLILAILAVYRVSILISRDYGPNFVFYRLRQYIDIRAREQQDNGKEYGFWVTTDEGINCPYCIGIWLAILCAILLLYPTRISHLFLFTFGLAGGQSLLQRMTE